MKIVILLLITLFSFRALSQDHQKDTSNASNKWSVTSFSLNMKPLIFKNYMSDFYNIKKRLKYDPVPSDFPSKEYATSISKVGIFDINLELGITFKSNRELLIGISYITGRRSRFNLTKKTIERFDSSVEQGIIFYSDSFTNSNYSYAEYIDELGLVLAYLYKSDQNKKLSVFAGIGINIAYSFTSVLSAESIHDTIVHKTTDKNPNDYLNNYKSDILLNGLYIGGGEPTDPNYFIRAYIPLGFNWHLSKTDDFGKHFNILFIAQIGLEYRHITSDLSYLRLYWGIPGLGLKYTF